MSKDFNELKFNPNNELREFFGTDDLLSILGIKSKEVFFQDTPNRSLSVRQAYLRTVLRNHPNSSGCEPDTLDEARETLIRSKRLYIMHDIFNLLTNTDAPVLQSRDEYFRSGTVPDLPSLAYLRSHPYNLKSPPYEVPPFEEIAAELKSLFLQQVKSIREMQEAMLSSTS